MSDGPDKVEDLMEEVSVHVSNGTVVFSRHALVRRDQRSIIEPEVEYVLKNGWWEKSRDRRSPNHGDSWSYSIRGKTVDGRRLRIIVALVDENDPRLLVVTAYDIDTEA